MTAAPMLTEATGTAHRPRKTPALIRVAVLDDHAAVRAGLKTILDSAPDMVSVGAAHARRSSTGCCDARTPRSSSSTYITPACTASR
jgi:hypothetical protein